MSSSAPPNLDGYLRAAVGRYEACLGTFSEPTRLSDFAASIRFHYLKLDGNGRPRWGELARSLADHVLAYCFSTRERNRAKSDVDTVALTRTAREFFRDSKRSGEAGEMLLFFLLEAVLRAPQMVSKISLKTNSEMETHGSDGVHMRWNDQEEMMEIYFGEAKLHQNLAKAISGAFGSVEKFHAKKMEDFELRLVSRHYKHADSALKKRVLKYVERGTAADTVRVNHAFLLGYDWEGYEGLKTAALKLMVEEFDRLYQADQQRILDLVRGRFSTLSVKHLRFEVFVLPFTSVDAFRQAFLEAL